MMTPKSLLRHVNARSAISDMTDETGFQCVNGDSECSGSDEVKKIVFCSGNIYYELLKERRNLDMTNVVALVRIKQISPPPYDLVKELLAQYSSAEVVSVRQK